MRDKERKRNYFISFCPLLRSPKTFFKISLTFLWKEEVPPKRKCHDINHKSFANDIKFGYISLALSFVLFVFRPSAFRQFVMHGRRALRTGDLKTRTKLKVKCDHFGTMGIPIRDSCFFVLSLGTPGNYLRSFNLKECIIRQS